MPRRVNLQQNSPEWLKWRQGGVGASEAAIIMHESPFKSPYRLWLEKTGRGAPDKQTFAMKHGVASEPFAREQFIRVTGINIEPVCFEYEDEPLIRASLDGWNEERHLVVEIKAPLSDRDHRRAKEGHIPEYYFLQMQHQMAVAAAKDGVYYSWLDGDGVAVTVQRNDEYWLTELLPAEQEFLRRVRENNWPRPEGVIHVDDRDFAMAVELRADAERRMHEAESEKLTSEALIRRTLGDAKTLIGAGIRASWIEWTPRYYVQVEVESSDDQLAVMKALLPLQDRKGVTKIEARSLPPNLVLRIAPAKKGG